MNIKAHLIWKIFDKDGNLKSEREHEANSLVKAFIANICACANRGTVTGLADTSNTSRDIAGSTGYDFFVSAASNDDNLGVVVGTGTTAVTVTDYALETQIAHGTGAGQLAYGASTVNGLITDGSTIYFNVSRVFTNNSGSSITVNEVGLYANIASASYYYMLDRTLSTQAIADTDTATCVYRLSVTV